jgi:hypothetical protein
MKIWRQKENNIEEWIMKKANVLSEVEPKSK